MSNRIEVLKTYKTYIGGNFPRTESGRYYKVYDGNGNILANACQCSRKDVRDAVVAARSTVEGWSNRTAYNRGQILYRIAEMLETRKAQFIEELETIGYKSKGAKAEVNDSIDRLIYYAGWADKYQQVFGTINPVASSHFNFSMPEPTGVVNVWAPEEQPLLGLISVITPVIVGGNTCVVLASEQYPLCAVSFAEVLNSSDVPGGVVNILTGFREELLEHMTTHMDVNAFFYTDPDIDQDQRKQIDENGALNLKHIVRKPVENWQDKETQSPYFITEFQETKTTWHPVGY
ncbi:aldehyde dehydrogenase family protein [Aliifodinibius salicampi]|uniref:Aldehyde dehydrogenase family protein n=1 Tax=Fodinibius salicampi TaxID=1920655 RepID=A0ABT3PVI6_9BACT|nr:aldehyde dehydrogenase family protein [Fodinibius salicampi]MCW9711857.1 aldehyde dehydrogenase family protein [Fodinibius salicampi]